MTDDDGRGHGDVGDFRCEVLPDADRAVICVAGDVDMATAPQLREALEQAAARRPGAVLVDLAGCAFLDSSGLAALVEANNRARLDGARFAIRAPNERILRLLEVTQLDRELPVED